MLAAQGTAPPLRHLAVPRNRRYLQDFDRLPHPPQPLLLQLQQPGDLFHQLVQFLRILLRGSLLAKLAPSFLVHTHLPPHNLARQPNRRHHDRWCDSSPQLPSKWAENLPGVQTGPANTDDTPFPLAVQFNIEQPRRPIDSGRHRWAEQSSTLAPTLSRLRPIAADISPSLDFPSCFLSGPEHAGSRLRPISS